MQAMNKMIACCGINCETCEARIATIKNDDKMRVEVAKKWYRFMSNSFNIRPAKPEEVLKRFAGEDR